MTANKQRATFKQVYDVLKDEEIIPDSTTFEQFKTMFSAS